MRYVSRPDVFACYLWDPVLGHVLLNNKVC
jgi:hypothetical protein